MSVTAKICGLNSEDAVRASVAAGAQYLGFNFYASSPRYVTPERAAELTESLPEHVKTTALFVDPTDDDIEEVLSATNVRFLQLHGSETVDRTRRIRSNFGRPVIKANPISGPSDVSHAKTYQGTADILLFDARPPEGDDKALPGGNGLPFDWALLAEEPWETPWILSGGLDAANVFEAVRISGATIVDVSSGVEDHRGHKSVDLIEGFLKTVSGL